MKSLEGSSSATGLKRLLSSIFLLAAVAVAAWFFMQSRRPAATAPDGGAQAKRPPAEAPVVRVHTVAGGEIRNTREYVGRVEAVDSVNLVARVSGYLRSIDFVEGRHVNSGDLMFTIEQDRFRAEIDARTGTVSQIEANLVEAEQYLGRLRSAREGSVPEKDIETAERNVGSYRAQLVTARANLDLARIDLEYATVRAPISGRVTKKNYSVGDFVGPNSGTIATIVQFDPIRVVCSMSEVEYLNLMEQSGASPENTFRPELRLPNGSVYSGRGRWDFADTAIDASTGTISLRSRYANPSGLLIPGGYVTVLLSSVKGETLPLVPQSAVGEDSRGSYVYVLGEGGIAERRFIKTRSALGQDWIVEEGLRAGETVVVEGIQKVRPGQVVQTSGAGAAAVPVPGGN